MPEIAIVGTGPYGLSIAAHLNRLGIPYRIFGRPMDSWISHMPKGMLLKSDGFASTICDPEAQLTLEKFCAERGITYAAMGIPVKLETFCQYGLTFREQLVPALEEKMVTSVAPNKDGFLLGLENGEAFNAREVILAVGITHFSYTPEVLQPLPAEYVSHSFQHSDPESFRERRVAVIGAGSSAIDLASLLHDAGSDVQIIARAEELKFHSRGSTDKPRSLWQQLRSPSSGLGPGLSSRFFANFPYVFHHLPESYRVEKVRIFLGPAGGWFAKEKIMGKVPMLLGHSIESAKVQGNRVSLDLVSENGSKRTEHFEHVIAATGYRSDLSRLTFLSPELRSRIKVTHRSPALSTAFESSVPGLYFTGLAAANSFGPVMRFAFGAGYTAKHLTAHLARLATRGRAWSAVPGVRVGQGSD
jgi:thioredoxin reductase